MLAAIRRAQRLAFPEREAMLIQVDSADTAAQLGDASAGQCNSIVAKYVCKATIRQIHAAIL